MFSLFWLAILSLQIGWSEMLFWKSRSRIQWKKIWFSRTVEVLCTSPVYHLQQMVVHVGKTNVLPHSPPEKDNLILHHKCLPSSGKECSSSPFSICLFAVFKHWGYFGYWGKRKSKLTTPFRSRLEWSGKMEVKLQRLGWVLHPSDTVILWTNVPESYPF